MCMFPHILPTKTPLIMKNLSKVSNAFSSQELFYLLAMFSPSLHEVFTLCLILIGSFCVFFAKIGKKEQFYPNLLAPEHLIKTLSYLPNKH